MRLILIALFAMPLLVHAQADVAEPLQPFAFLVGDWAGSAWYASPGGERNQVYQTEHVQVKLGGQVLLVEGTGRADSPDGEIVFEALGILSYDAQTHQYHLDAWNDGRYVRADVTPVEGGFDWGFDAGGRQIRYEMRLEDGRWHETGHMLLESGQSVPFVELTLERVAETP